MITQQAVSGILFADIVGSSQLYELLGDVEAERSIAETLRTLSRICQEHQGSVIKTIGDEIMCRFDNVDTMIACAIAMQKNFNHSTSPKSTTTQSTSGRLSAHSIKIGLHLGPTIMRNDDVFGDSVNVAARLVEYARRDQVICTTSTWRKANLDMLTRLDAKGRSLSAIPIKGKSQRLPVHEILWRTGDSDLTRLVTLPHSVECLQPWQLRLNYFGVTLTLSPDKPSIALGRGLQTGLPVSISSASRAHAKIISNQGQVTLIDQSTNGTFVKAEGQEEVQIHRQTIPLRGKGVISLGIPGERAPEHLISYEYIESKQSIENSTE